MLSQLGHLPRFVRLTLIITFLIVIPTLYFLYPTPERLPSKGEYQSGGIDSEHWREPIKPDYLQSNKEEVREWDDDDSPSNQQSINKVDGGGGKWKGISDKTLNGGVIMPKLGNETAKAELGRSAWKVLHLMTLRYPDEPTEDDRQALKSYFHLFSRLYPCGECATEFQALLKEYPPQTSSRKSASLWLCHVHNLVNERLGKPEFDCLTLDETYDCGCGDESATGTAPTGPKTKTLDEDAEEAGLRGEKEDERGLKDELVLDHGGGEVHLKPKPNSKAAADEDEDGVGEHHKGLKWTEDGSHHGKYQQERPIHNVPKLPIKPIEDEDQGTALTWDEESHRHQDTDGDHSSGKKTQKQQQYEDKDSTDELQREYEDDQTRYEKERDNVKSRHDGSTSKNKINNSENDDTSQWEE